MWQLIFTKKIVDNTAYMCYYVLLKKQVFNLYTLGGKLNT